MSYLKDGWNLTAYVSQEINTKNTITQYQTGNILHAEFIATKTINNWTFGPVGYFMGQVTDDKPSPFYGNAINTNRYGTWAAGGLVGYNFGPVQLNVWAVNQLSAHASGGTAAAPGIDTASIIKGFSVFSQLSFRLWAPDEPVSPRTPLLRK